MNALPTDRPTNRPTDTAYYSEDASYKDFTEIQPIGPLLVTVGHTDTDTIDPMSVFVTRASGSEVPRYCIAISGYIRVLKEYLIGSHDPP